MQMVDVLNIVEILAFHNMVWIIVEKFFIASGGQADFS